MENQRKLDKLSKLAGLLLDNTITPTQAKQLVELLVNAGTKQKQELIKQFNDVSDTLTQQTYTKLQEAVSIVSQKHADALLEVRQLTNKQRKAHEDMMSKCQDLLEDINSIEVRDGIDGKDGVDGKDGKDGSPDTPDQVVDKVNESTKKIKKERIEGGDKLVEQANLDRAISILDQRTQFLINKTSTSSSGGGTWGSITGTLSDQTDLQSALDAKQDDITLTTTGTSGAATLVGSTLNIPQYAGTIDGSGTTNELVYWVDSNTVGALAVATYPSLTELSYVKGLTSSAQTQINTKANSSGALTQFVGNGNWKVWYSDGSGDVQEVALGADGTFLKSNGVAVAPTFATPAGSGDVSKVGTPVDNQIGVWTGDGTIEGQTTFTWDNTKLQLGSSASTATATPVYIDMGGTYGNGTPGATGNLKWKLYSDGTAANDYGIGMTTGLMEFRSGASAEIAFFVNNGVRSLKLNSTGTATFDFDVTVPDEAYGAGWNGSLEVPTKNALYDKIETISSGQTLYEAIVATSGGDYTTLGAAITAGKTRIFVRNGTYSESAISTSTADISIIGESPLAVLSFGTASCTFSGARINIQNISFVNTTAGVVTFSGANARIFNCKFSGTATTTTQLVFSGAYSIVEMCTFGTYGDGAGDKVTVGGDRMQIRNCTINHGTIGNSSSYGFFALTANRSTISGCTGTLALSSNDCLFRIAGGDQMIITGNNILIDGGKFIGITNTNSSVMISNNYSNPIGFISHNSSASTQGMVCTGNNMQINGIAGAYFTKLLSSGTFNYCNFSDNVISFNASVTTAIQLGGTNNIVSNNIMKDNAPTTALVMASGSNNNIITGNQFMGSTVTDSGTGNVSANNI